MATTFAQLALGAGYEAVLMVSNKTAFQWKGSIDVYSEYGKLWQGSWAVNGQSMTGLQSGTFTLQPKATSKFRITGDTITRTGYLEVEGDSSYSTLDVAVSYFYEYRINGVLQDTVGSPESAWDKSFELNVEKSPTVDTGIAWCPTYHFSTPTFLINLSLYDSTGALTRSKQVAFIGHDAQFISELFPDLPTSFLGHLRIDSQDYIYLEVLRMERTSGSGFQLTSTPADNYVP
jgi:hypothetical protein